MWKRIKDIAIKYPKLTSLVTFILFFLSIEYILKGGWQLALIISLSLAVHEYSHVLAMKIYKIPVKGVIFIPFLGAVAIGGTKGKIWTRQQECFIALAGPVMGYLTALPLWLLWKTTDNLLYIYGMGFVIFLNLFNMLPMSPLDGGRVIKSLLMSISWKYRKIGFFIWGILVLGSLLLFAKLFLRSSYGIMMMVLLGWFGFQEIRFEWHYYRAGQMINWPLSKKAIIGFLFAYLVLASWPFLLIVYL
ncbi:MAG: hypothetical protein COU51_03480 [Parcubacteria group bacterium CG10_big_fil_rev_8_21_14_0_10_36_14]|nr:MAG: hypothetical protein COU51_03480 [Parcubacteria group bacterium CG10_big_fil_rev_8_21_14_0_10_36_14]